MNRNTKKFYHGAAYYPELWSPAERVRDIQQMKELNINVVRMGEFAWSTMEPEPDMISLDFFIETMDMLHQAGISTVFCTPTPTPPVWLTHGHPERLHVNEKGERMNHGARQHICTNNGYFRERTAVIVEAIAKKLSGHPGLIAWQIDNEFKGHVSECHCDTCRDLWHVWLKKNYGNISSLNDSWGNALWSQTYQNFEQIPVPLTTPFAHNPSLSTAFRRFHREAICEFQSEQIKVIRKYSSAPITHNSNLRHYIDHNQQCKELDFASFDDYHDCDNYHGMMMNYDLWRNIKPDVPFWVMETSPSHNGCIFGYRRTHRHRYLAAEAVAAYASGAEAFCYWLWRQQHSGVEMPHGAIITSWGTPHTGYDDVKEVGRTLDKISPVLKSSRPAQADIGIIYSDMARAFFLTEPIEGLDYLELMSDWYRIVAETGFHRDLLLEDNPLDSYKVIMTPFLPYIAEQLQDKAEKFVRNGGTWIIGPLSGGRTFEHTAHTDAGLGSRLEQFAGIKTAFMFSPTNSEETGEALGIEAPLSLWSSFFELDGAEAVGKVCNGRCPGKVFLTEHSVGKGKIVMLGSMPEGETGREMLKRLIFRYTNGIDKPEVSPGTEAIPRLDSNGLFYFLVNMNGQGGSIKINGICSDLITGKKYQSGQILLEPYEYRIIRPEN